MREKKVRLTKAQHRTRVEQLIDQMKGSAGNDYRNAEDLRMKLHRALVSWAKEDLQAASDFIEGSELGRKGNFWMTGMLASLAETDALLAFSHGLKLNTADNRYAVQPSGLLKIATLHLGPEEVIAAMDQKRLVGSVYEENCLFPDDKNLQKIADAILAKYRAAVANGEKWQPTVAPKNFVSTWAAKDAPAAFAYCVAMNELQDEEPGKEFIGYALGITNGPREEAQNAINTLLMDKKLNFDRNHLAWTFVTSGAEVATIFLDSLIGIPAEARDRMGSAAMERVVHFEMGPQEGEMAACLKVMASDEARFEAARSAGKRLPQFGAEAVKHLRDMGYSESVISEIIPSGGSSPPPP